MKYGVYLTKSREVAGVIARAFKVGEMGVHAIEDGNTSGFKEIPEMYQNEKMFCCIVKYCDDADVPPYRLVIA